MPADERLLHRTETERQAELAKLTGTKSKSNSLRCIIPRHREWLPSNIRLICRYLK